MKTIWRDQTINVREVDVNPEQISLHDWLLHNGEFLRVVTIQKDCPRWDSSSPFTMWTCETEDGKIVPVRDLRGRQKVLKKNRARYVSAA